MTIKASELLETVKAVGKEFPNELRNCIYFDGDQPCCIVGLALSRHGVSGLPFHEDEDLNAATNVKELFTYHADELGLELDDPDSLTTLQNVQYNQDHHYNWGEAVSRALDGLGGE